MKPSVAVAAQMLQWCRRGVRNAKLKLEWFASEMHFVGTFDRHARV